jgi:putative transferase (TIGR04331 family)
MEHFSNVVTTDLWNHAIYSSILKYLRFKKIKILNVPIDKPKWNIKRPNKKRYMITKIKKFLVTFCLFFSRNKDYFFMDTYLTKFDLVKLQLKLGQFPVFYSVPNYTELIPKEINRSITLSEFKCNNSFEHYLREVLPLQIPKAYIEGYKNLSKLTKNMHWPKKPKLIWTSISFYMDEIFKLWAANKIEEGVPLVIGQHGGNYGQAMFNMGEYHELKICDYYLSWGWKTHLKKIIPIGSFKKPIKNKIKNSNQISILLILSGSCRYNGSIQSAPMSTQWINYFDDQIKFYGKLPNQIANNVNVRLYPYDYEWSQYERWKEKFPNSKFDKCEKDFNNAIMNTNLLISGWNTTAYLETMMSNIPTLIFWDPKFFEIRKDAKELFEELKKVGIFHDNINSAVTHVKNVWRDIDLWWNLPDVKLARDHFTTNYACSHNVVNNLCDAFRDISNRKDFN